MPESVHATESLTKFTKDPDHFLEKLRQDGGPMLLTVEGAAGVVVQDADSYQRFLQHIDQLEAIAGVKEGLRDLAAGRMRPMREALRELAIKHKLPGVAED